ncbi:MAG: ribonuclease PH [Actinomycetes bacterium]|jgi:ribonuclease PH|nr:ribonuclease PH [Actinomycetes bacterium]
MRIDNRANDELRPVDLQIGVLDHAAGSCLISFGKTRVLCAATISEGTANWLAGSGKGWVTAEYALLPASTHTRSWRERHGAKGRTLEIERLIARSLRSAIDLNNMGGEITLTVDCDVLQADGGTRTAAITGGYVAMVLALRTWHDAGKLGAIPVTGQVAAVSAGLVDGEIMLDLDYSEDANAEVDMNVVMDDRGRFIELQGTGERINYTREQLDALLATAQTGIDQLLTLQAGVLDSATDS